MTACIISIARAPLPEGASDAAKGIITDKVADTFDLLQTSIHSIHSGFADVQIQAKDTITQIQTGIKNLPGAFYNALPRYTVQGLGSLMVYAGWQWCKNGFNHLGEYCMPLESKPSRRKQSRIKKSKSVPHQLAQKERKSKSELGQSKPKIDNEVDYQFKKRDYYTSRRNRGVLEIIAGTITLGTGLYILCNPQKVINAFTSEPKKPNFK
jgi:hypothetical protein